MWRVCESVISDAEDMTVVGSATDSAAVGAAQDRERQARGVVEYYAAWSFGAGISFKATEQRR